MREGFRYSPVKYNESLLSLGNIRIGTLHDFRRIEHRKGVGDANEGKKLVSHHIDYATATNDSGVHSRALKEFQLLDVCGAEQFSLSNVKLMKNVNYPDCFVHCMSVEYSSNVLEQFDGADSCVHIIDMEGFYSRLTETLNLNFPVTLVAISEVEYASRDEVWNGEDWGLNPALIKEHIFSGQKEIRAIWRPKFKGSIKPIVLNDIGLIEFCRRIDLPE